MKFQKQYLMFYSDWDHICMAKSADGKTFTRQLGLDGKAAMFQEGLGNRTRDPMVLRIGKMFYLYYTAYPNHQGVDYLRTSKDLRHWSASSKVAFGGVAGTNPYAAESPFVYYHRASGYYYLFRTQTISGRLQSSIYRSKDPRNFGVNDDSYLVGTIPYAAPEIVEDKGVTYIAVLLPDFKGIQIANLKFAPMAR
jgi:sucrose-6-phosphate hydrolase SacC (GH32 family)